jgi:hypothetical protein
MSTRPVAVRPTRNDGRSLSERRKIRAIEGFWIAEDGGRLFERHSVLGAVDRGLPRVPLEHNSVYTKLAAAGGGGARLGPAIEAVPVPAEEVDVKAPAPCSPPLLARQAVRVQAPRQSHPRG